LSVVYSPSRVDLRSAAERRNCSIATVRRRIADGSLPAVRNGNKYEVNVADLDRVFAPVPIEPTRNSAAAAFEALESAARRVAAQAPPLSQRQRARLTELLGGAR
jgi:excisionase family DNA binding protein